MPLKTQHEEPTLNLTPMIDIVFLLIIFFMVGTKFAEMERQIKLEVPRVTTSVPLTAEPEKKVINLYRDGTVTLDGQNLSLEQLTTELQQSIGEYPDLGVVVRGDRVVAFENVTTVLAACQDAGVPRMAISVRPDSTQR